MADAGTTPSATLLAQLDAELQRHVPFAQMAPPHRHAFVRAAELVYFAPDEVVLEPASGPVRQLYLVREGGVVGDAGARAAAPFAYEAGELFPVAAVLGARAVDATYRARVDTFCLRVPAAVVEQLAAASAPFAEHLNRRLLQLLELSREQLQERFASQAVGAHALDEPLARFVRGAPLAVSRATPLAAALTSMHARGVGSVVVVDGERPCGILTRHDLLERVVLAERALATPIGDVMSAPLHTLDVSRRAHDAALVMARESLRHVPITDGGRLVGIVSERDLFALQRLSMRQLGAEIDGADGVASLRRSAADIRRFAAQLIAQGVHAHALTGLISSLNDRLTARLVALLAAEHRVDLAQGCWLAFGSEGRSEQTIATDQDNGIVHAAGAQDAWLAFGDAVNRALDDCGYPLCKGGIMAGQRDCCLTLDAWRERFAHWILHGAPEDLLRASIFFDLRAIAGDAALAAPLRELIVEQGRTPRFLKQMAVNALQQRAPLAWHGGIAGDEIDLKLQGTAIFVEAARIVALAAGVGETGTRERLLAAAPKLGVRDDEAQGWVAGFEALQLLRLSVQAAGAAAGDANRCRIETLNAIERRVLREALHVARSLQQRLELDYLR